MRRQSLRIVVHFNDKIFIKLNENLCFLGQVSILIPLTLTRRGQMAHIYTAKLYRYWFSYWLTIVWRQAIMSTLLAYCKRDHWEQIFLKLTCTIRIIVRKCNFRKPPAKWWLILWNSVSYNSLRPSNVIYRRTKSTWASSHYLSKS